MIFRCACIGLGLFNFLFLWPASEAGAVVVQSASEALRSDIFVKGAKSNSDTNRETREAEKAKQKTKDSKAAQTTSHSEPASPYTKHASKLFQTYSGHITIEQNNIPRRIAISKGSTLQLNLNEQKDTIWNIEMNNKIARIKSDTVNGDKKILILEAINKGKTKLLIDNILTQKNNYKVLVKKRMLLIVD